MPEHLYRHFDKEDNLLYVGISLSALNRLSQHSQNSHWFNRITKVTIQNFASREESVKAERESIINENPLHNLKRPKSVKQTCAEISKDDLVSRIVQFDPMYTEQEAAQILGTSTTGVRQLMRENKLSHVLVPTGRGGNKVKISGWQLISFIEYLEKSNITQTHLT